MPSATTSIDEPPRSRSAAAYTVTVRALLLTLLAAAPPVTAATHTPLGPAASAPPELAMSFEAAAVLATGLTPAGEAIVFSIARVPLGYTQRVEHRVEPIPVDPLGEAYYELEAGAPAPTKSVWAVVDTTTGLYVIDSPQGFPATESPFPGNAFAVGASGLVNRMRHTFEWVDMVVVRPAVGAWRLRASDGGPGDADGEPNGRTVTSLEDAEPIGAAPLPPERFLAGDVVIVLDPRRLRFYATSLLGAPGGGS